MSETLFERSGSKYGFLNDKIVGKRLHDKRLLTEKERRYL